MMCGRCSRVLKTKGHMFNGEDDKIYCHHCTRQICFERMRGELGRVVAVKINDPRSYKFQKHEGR